MEQPSWIEKAGQDFTAAVFDTAGAALGGLWGLLPWYVHWGVYGALALVALWVIKTLRDLGGWPLVGAALLGFVGLASGLFGFQKGREWAEARKPVVAPKPKKRKTLTGR